MPKRDSLSICQKCKWTVNPPFKIHTHLHCMIAMSMNRDPDVVLTEDGYIRADGRFLVSDPVRWVTEGKTDAH